MVQFYRGRPLTAVEIEDAITQTMDTLEATLETLEKRSKDAAGAEADYRIKYAGLMLTADRKTDAMRQAHAMYNAADEYRARKIAEALRDVTQEACRVRRSEMEALRTLAANVRSAETGRG